MPSVYAGEIIRVCDVGRLAAADIAAATGARETLVRAWLSGTTAPTGEPAERLMELSGLVERLARVITADYIPVWLHQPNRCLDDRPPAEKSGL